MKHSNIWLSLLSCVTAAVSTAAAADFVWTGTDGADGLFTDPASWGESASYPGATSGGEAAVFPAAAGRESNVYFPDGVFDNYSSFRTYIAAGQSTTFIGTNTTWNVAATTNGTANGQCVVYMLAETSSSTPKRGSFFRDAKTDGSARLTLKNFKVRHSNTPERGTCLDILEGEISSPVDNWFYLDSDNRTDASGRTELCFHPGTKSTLKGLYIGSMNATNAFTFLGGTHSLGWWRQQYNVGNPSAGGARRVDFTFRGGASVSSSSGLGLGFRSGQYNSKDILFNVSATEGARVVLSNSSFSCGTFDFDVSGEGTFWQFRHDASFGTVSNSHVNVRIADGATLSIADVSSVTFGGSSAAALEDTSFSFVLTNATLDINVSEKPFTINDGVFTACDSDIVFRWGSYITAGGVDGAAPEGLFDGVRITAITSEARFLSGFTKFALGTKGLYINRLGRAATYDITQPFCDAPGAQGELRLGTEAPDIPYLLSAADSTQSRLVLDGCIAKLTSGANHYTHLVVPGGSVFSMVDGASSARLRALTLGDESDIGEFRLDVGDEVTVEGPVALTNAVFSYSTELSAGRYTVFRSTAATAEEKRRWKMGIGFVVEGVADDAFMTYVVTEAEGVSSFIVVVSDTLPECAEAVEWSGDVTLESDRTVDAVRFTDTAVLSGAALTMRRTSGSLVQAAKGDVSIESDMLLYEFVDSPLEINVAEGATLEISGRIQGGGILKTGKGRLVLSNPLNELPLGVTASEGVLSAADPLALGKSITTGRASCLAGGTLEISGNESGGVPGLPLDITSSTSVSGGVVLASCVPASVKLGESGGASFFKRGAEPFAFLVDDHRTLNLTSYRAVDLGATLASFPEDGSVPDVPRGSLNFVEGEFAFRSLSERKIVTLPAKAANGGAQCRIYLPYPTSDSVDSHPRFVLDNVYLDAPGHAFWFGGVTKAALTAGKAELVVTNGATLNCWTFNTSPSVPNAKMEAVAVLDNGRLKTQSFNPNDSGSRATTNRFTFSASSELLVRTQNECTGPAELVFDNSIYSGSTTNAVAQALKFKKDFSDGDTVLRISFLNGSVFRCAGVTAQNTAGGANAPAKLRFDDSEWFAGAADLTLPGTKCDTETTVTGVGLRLAPPEGYTWTWTGSLDGSGGLVVSGEGTVLLSTRTHNDADTGEPVLCCEGTVKVESGVLAVGAGSLSDCSGRVFEIGGTLDLREGEFEGLALSSAGGNIVNGSLVRPSVNVVKDPATGATSPITFDYAAGCAVSGRVKFAFEGEYAKGEKVVAARWTGTKPDVTSWRATPLDRSHKFAFTAEDDGTVLAEVVDRGGIAIVVR